MNEVLYTLLSGIAPTWHLRLDGSPPVGITYQLYLGQDQAHQSGAALRESGSYRVSIFQKRFDQGLIDRVITALRAGGWRIGTRTQLYDDANKYFLFALNTTKWSDLS